VVDHTASTRLRIMASSSSGRRQCARSLLIARCTDTAELFCSLQDSEPESVHGVFKGYRRAFQVSDSWWFHVGNPPLSPSLLLPPVNSIVESDSPGTIDLPPLGH